MQYFFHCIDSFLASSTFVWIRCWFTSVLFWCRCILKEGHEVHWDCSGAVLFFQRTTNRLGTCLIFPAAVSTFMASFSSSAKRFFNDWAWPLVGTTSSLFAYCSVILLEPLWPSGGVIDFLNFIAARNEIIIGDVNLYLCVSPGGGVTCFNVFLVFTVALCSALCISLKQKAIKSPFGSH